MRCSPIRLTLLIAFEVFGNIFAAKDISSELTRKWLAEEDVHVDVNLQDPRLDLTMQHVKDVIKLSSESSPGRDGIPYRAYKNHGMAPTIIFDALHEIINNL